MYSLAELKTGKAIIHNDDPFLITYNQFSKQGRQGGVMSVKMKNLKTGNTIQHTFQGSDKVAPADVGYSKVQYLYKDEDGMNFMDLTSYEQFTLNEDQVGDMAKYLADGQEVDAMNFEGTPIGLRLPSTVILEVTETIPGVKGDTATGGTKPATMASGLTVSVPLFIKEGEMLRINTDTGEYMNRAND